MNTDDWQKHQIAQRYKERNQKIVEMRNSGYTWKAIGEQFGLSYERVRQIYVRKSRGDSFPGEMKL